MADDGWVRSSFCSSDNGCVEVHRLAGLYYLRDSNRPGSGSVAFTRAEIDAFVQGWQAGEFTDG